MLLLLLLLMMMMTCRLRPLNLITAMTTTTATPDFYQPPSLSQAQVPLYYTSICLVFIVQYRVFILGTLACTKSREDLRVSQQSSEL